MATLNQKHQKEHLQSLAFLYLHCMNLFPRHFIPVFRTNTNTTPKTKDPVKSEDTRKNNHDEGKTKEMARVKFVYEPQHPDELRLGEIGERASIGDIFFHVLGALIEIIRKDCGDPGWFEGELNGKVGLFPDNFVEVVQVALIF